MGYLFDVLHAALWHGTAASYIDLMPTGYSQSEANGVFGSTQVGYGNGGATGGEDNALLWHGTASSAVDLQQYLTGLPVVITSSLGDSN